MHILVFIPKDSLHRDIAFLPRHKKAIEKLASDLTVTITHHPTQKQLATAEVLLPIVPLRNIPFAAMQSLQLLHLTSAGTNTVPDTVWQSNIIVTNSSGVHAIPIAEHIFTYLLMFARGIDYLHRDQIIEKTWSADKNYPVFELYGKTIGIVGLGRIGARVAELAKAFHMNVLAIVADPSRKRDNTDVLFALDALPKLLKDADFVINCLPGTPETEKLFDRHAFSTMKRSAYFINVGRGSSVVEKDLITALRKKTIAGAGLDVFAVEPLPDTSPLWELPNVLITPHTSGRTPYYMNRVVDIFCENLKAYLAKKPLSHEVDKKRRY